MSWTICNELNIFNELDYAETRGQCPRPKAWCQAGQLEQAGQVDQAGQGGAGQAIRTGTTDSTNKH